jgi:hypothetical protein
MRGDFSQQEVKSTSILCAFRLAAIEKYSFLRIGTLSALYEAWPDGRVAKQN